MSTPPPKPPRASGFAVAGTVLYAALVLGLYVLYVFLIPSAKKTFDESGLAIPWITEFVIRLSNGIVEYWWVTVLLLVLVGIGNFGLLKWLGQHRSFIAMLWIAGVSLVLVAVGVVTIAATELPMIKLKEELAK